MNRIKLILYINDTAYIRIYLPKLNESLRQFLYLIIRQAFLQFCKQLAKKFIQF